MKPAEAAVPDPAAFSAGWLQRRAPFDAAARQRGGLPVPPVRRDARGVLHALDLGCGLGANFLHLAPRLGGMQRWRLCDRDAGLLALLVPALAEKAHAQGWRVAERAPGPGGDAAITLAGEGWEATVSPHRLDLAGEFDRLPFEGVGLVSASALLDLVSAAWLSDLVARCRAAGAAVVFALSVDGRIGWPDTDPDDAAVLERFALHQRSDKGFGPALGGRAPAAAASALRAAGYQVQGARSDWWLDRDLQREVLLGIADAAVQADPAAAAMAGAWRARRIAAADDARPMTVGHLDLAGWLELAPAR